MIINVKDGFKSTSYYVSWSSSVLFYVLFMLFLSSPDAIANGAAGSPGLYGNEIIVSDRPPINSLVVDEEVVLDFRDKSVKVDYKIINSSSQPVQFNMVFPIDDHRAECNSEVPKEATIMIPYQDELNFRALLNGKRLPSRQVRLSDVKLEGDYGRLRRTACYSFIFSIQLQPGSNQLIVNYNLIPSISWLGGGRRYYSYSLWPAKNWVPVFRKALWRVFPPEKSKRSQEFFIVGNLKQQLEDWYTIGDDTSLFNWHKYSFDVQGPGTKIPYSDHIDFVADNFVPDGSVVVNLFMHKLSQTVTGCTTNELKNCWLKALESTLSIRPYRGDQNCYDESDLKVVMVKDLDIGDFIFSERAVPFLRNEIYARKGYMFTSDKFKQFYEHMPWYNPKHENVQLNKVEKWNMDFLQEIEKEIRSEQAIDEDVLVHVYNRMRELCPSVASSL